MRKSLSYIIVLGICELISKQSICQSPSDGAGQLVVGEISNQVPKEYKYALPQRQSLSTVYATLVSGPIVEKQLYFEAISYNWNSEQTVLPYLKESTAKDLILQLLWGSVITPPKNFLKPHIPSAKNRRDFSLFYKPF